MSTVNPCYVLFFADANSSISASQRSKTSVIIHRGCAHDLLTFLGSLTKLVFISY